MGRLRACRCLIGDLCTRARWLCLPADPPPPPPATLLGSGWQFNGEGACTVIPQGGDAAAPRACATAFECEARQSLIWVRLEPPAASTAAADAPAAAAFGAPGGDAIPALPELEDPDWFELAPMWRDLPMDYATLIENVVDASHVPFTHHKSVSKRESSGSFADMAVTGRGAWGFAGRWASGPRRGGLGAQETLFAGPNLMRHTIDAFSTRGFANVTAVYGTPTAPGRCRLFVRQPFRFKNKVVRALFALAPTFLAHLGNLNVLDDDNIFLHWQEREAARRGLGARPAGQVFFMPTPADAYVAAFRVWLEAEGGGGPFGRQGRRWLAAAGPRLPRAALLDHYGSHVASCKICQAALRRMKVARAAAAALAVLGAVAAVAATAARLAAGGAAPPAAVPLAAGAAAVALVAALVWRWCAATLPRFYSGSWPPPRNVAPGEWKP